MRNCNRISYFLSAFGRLCITKMRLEFYILTFSLVVIGQCLDINHVTGGKGPYPDESSRREICIEELGCFPETDPENKPTGYFDRFIAWASETIDSEFWRSTRKKVNTQFRFWTPSSTKAEFINNYDFHVHITKDSGYDPNLKAIFIIHGYHGGDAEWAVAMKDALMLKEPSNIFIVDWSDGDGLLYGTAVANTWVVGAETGRFIERIVRLTGMNPSNVHIIGHSLGAHTAGFAGKYVKDRLKNRMVGRITGLDPAGPDFDDVVPGERLDKNDAEFVDIIHTNWASSALGGLGLLKPIGHFDFYPNGGDDQAGCPTAEDASVNIAGETLEYINPTFKLASILYGDDDSMSDAFDDLACSHGRAYEFFIESILNDNCLFLADQCTSWQDYTEGKCPPGSGGNLRVPMGYEANRFRNEIDRNQHKKFYLRTRATSPFCIE